MKKTTAPKQPSVKKILVREGHYSRIAKKPHLNPWVRAFIESEAIFWSGWGLINPVFAIFVLEHIVGGSITHVGVAATLSYIARMFGELASGRLLVDSSVRKKLLFMLGGLFISSFAYLSLILVSGLVGLYLVLMIWGFAFGFATPPKLSLFSLTLDKGQEAREWSFNDALSYGALAISASAGSWIADRYGFSLLFGFVAAMMILSIIPYAMLFHKDAK